MGPASYAPAADGGLYDEPAFAGDAERENPMYASNENVDADPGGYLDVQPDEYDDDSNDEAGA